MSRKHVSVERQHSVRPCLEALEDRQLLSASAFSNLGGVPVRFDLQPNGHLQETIGTVHKDLGLVQGLFQGTDNVWHNTSDPVGAAERAGYNLKENELLLVDTFYQGGQATSAGHQVVYELSHHSLKEFTPDHGWVSDGKAKVAMQTGDGEVLFAHGKTLYEATGVPGEKVAVQGNVYRVFSAGREVERDAWDPARQELTQTRWDTHGHLVDRIILNGKTGQETETFYQDGKATEQKTWDAHGHVIKDVTVDSTTTDSSGSTVRATWDVKEVKRI